MTPAFRTSSLEQPPSHSYFVSHQNSSANNNPITPPVISSNLQTPKLSPSTENQQLNHHLHLQQQHVKNALPPLRSLNLDLPTNLSMPSLSLAAAESIYFTQPKNVNVTTTANNNNTSTTSPNNNSINNRTFSSSSGKSGQLRRMLEES